VIRVTRVRDDPERREAERDAADELARLAAFRALDEWTESVSQLATWVRYALPPPNAKPIEPWFDDQSEDDDGGPETIHGQNSFRASFFHVVAAWATVDVGTLRLVSVRPPYVFPALRSMFNSIKVAAGY
jgi:hypothetical protein